MREDLKSFHNDYQYVLHSSNPQVDLEIEDRFLFIGGEVHQGYHSFIDINDAIYAHNLYGHLKVVECIIPKGSKYIKGTNPDGSKGFVSNQIIINKILEN